MFCNCQSAACRPLVDHAEGRGPTLTPHVNLLTTFRQKANSHSLRREDTLEFHIQRVIWAFREFRARLQSRVDDLSNAILRCSLFFSLRRLFLSASCSCSPHLRVLRERTPQCRLRGLLKKNDAWQILRDLAMTGKLASNAGPGVSPIGYTNDARCGVISTPLRLRILWAVICGP